MLLVPPLSPDRRRTSGARVLHRLGLGPQLLRGMDAFFDFRTVWWAGLVAIFVSFALATTSYAAKYSFSSDDVAIQNIVQAVQSGQSFKPTTGSATWALKVPVYLLVDFFMPNGTANIVVSVILSNIPLVLAMALLARWMVLRYADGRRDILLGALIVLLCFFGSRAAQYSALMGPNSRNGEIGIALVAACGLFAALRVGLPRKARVAIFAAFVVVLSLLILDDTLWLYVFVPTVLLTLVVGWLRSALTGKAVVTGVAALALGSGGGELALRAAQAAGLTISQNFNSTLITPAGVLPGIGGSFGAVMRNLNADVWGRALDAGLVPPAVQFVFGLVCLALAIVAISRLRADPGVLRAFLAVGVAVDLALDVATGNAAVDLNFRYAMPATVFVLLLAVLGMCDLVGRANLRRAAVAVTAVGLACAVLGGGLNLHTSFASATGQLPDPQGRTRAVIRIAEARGLRVGLGEYWDASVTSYFSARKVVVSPAVCGATGIDRFDFLVNEGDSKASSQHMFVISSDGLGCTAADIRHAFGAPSRSVPLSTSADRVWIYDRPLAP